MVITIFFLKPRSSLHLTLKTEASLVFPLQQVILFILFLFLLLYIRGQSESASNPSSSPRNSRHKAEVEFLIPSLQELYQCQGCEKHLCTSSCCPLFIRSVFTECLWVPGIELGPKDTMTTTITTTTKPDNWSYYS